MWRWTRLYVCVERGGGGEEQQEHPQPRQKEHEEEPSAAAAAHLVPVAGRALRHCRRPRGGSGRLPDRGAAASMGGFVSARPAASERRCEERWSGEVGRGRQ